MPMLRGMLDPLVLKTLSWSPMHAFEITTWLEERSGGRVEVDDAALLQALHRMEQRRLIDGEWGVTKNGRRARYYRITPAGREHLRAESAWLVDHFDAVTSILTLKRHSPCAVLPPPLPRSSPSRRSARSTRRGRISRGSGISILRSSRPKRRRTLGARR